MRGLALGIVIVLAGFTFPAASATGGCYYTPGGAAVCAGDWGTYTGCEEPGEFSSENTGVAVSAIVAYASVTGSHSCSHFCLPWFGCFRSESEGIVAVAYVPGAYAYGGWSTAFGQCRTYVGAATLVFGTYQSTGCPAGSPPDLPWGHVLP